MNHLKVGILGTGQLSWMLATKGEQLGLSVKTFSDPLQTMLEDQIESLDSLTFESEFYKAQDLRLKLSKFKGRIFPSLDCLGLLQDRWSQKTSLQDSDLPTSPFWKATSPSELTALFLSRAPLVAKKRTGGYDGYGTFVLKTKKDLNVFLDNHSAVLMDFIFEKWIHFQAEWAVQVARSRAGDVQFFPVVETVQKNHKCFYVCGPEKPLSALFEKKISKWLNKIDYVGVIGIEFFKTKSGLIINEVAPRVHNTGHHSLNSCTVDQFTMHWLCATQDQLPTPKPISPEFLMLNLIGKSEQPVKFPKLIDGHLYWYKKTNRSGRKLGHINWTGKNRKALLERALMHLKKWRL